MWTWILRGQKAFLSKRTAGVKATEQCCPLVDYKFRLEALKLTKSNDTDTKTTLDFSVIDFFLMAAMLPGTQVAFPTLIFSGSVTFIYIFLSQQSCSTAEELSRTFVDISCGSCVSFAKSSCRTLTALLGPQEGALKPPWGRRTEPSARLGLGAA